MFYFSRTQETNHFEHGISILGAHYTALQINYIRKKMLSNNYFFLYINKSGDINFFESLLFVPFTALVGTPYTYVNEDEPKVLTLNKGKMI